MAPDTTNLHGAKSRLTGVDLARALAVIGMLAVHFRPKDKADLTAAWFHALPHGRASVLFVLVAGVGIALLSRRVEEWPRARLRLFSFALFLLPLGLWLQTLEHHVAVILHHYAAFYLLGMAVLGLVPRKLAALAIVTSVLGPMLYLFGRMALPSVFDRESVGLGDTPIEIGVGLIASGAYPLLSWAGPLIAGIWIGRLDLRSVAVRKNLVIWGAVVAVGAFLLSTILVGAVGEPASRTDPRFLVTDSPHSQMPLWVIGATGSAAAVLGAALHLADRYPRAMALPIALGQMALTIYVLHILLLVGAGDAIRQETVLPSMVAVAVFAALAASFAIIWRSAFGRGPIERAMHVVWETMDTTLSGSGQPERRRGAQDRSAGPIPEGLPKS